MASRLFGPDSFSVTSAQPMEFGPRSKPRVHWDMLDLIIDNAFEIEYKDTRF